MDGRNLEAVQTAWIRLRDRLDPALNQLNWVAFVEIASGRIPTLDEAAKRIGMGPDQARRVADEAVRRGLLTLDGGRITGSRGLSAVPTSYQVRMGDHDLFTWCALDAVGIPASLGKDARIKATLLDGTAPVVVEIQEGRVKSSHPSDLRIALPSPTLDRSVRETLCPRIGFHSADNVPGHDDISVLTLDEAAELGRKLWKRPGNPTA